MLTYTVAEFTIMGRMGISKRFAKSKKNQKKSLMAEKKVENCGFIQIRYNFFFNSMYVSMYAYNLYVRIQAEVYGNGGNTHK